MTTLLSRRFSQSSRPPGYTPEDMELAHIDSASPSILSAPPPYSEAVPSSSSTTPFRPSAQLQIETQGKPWLSFPFDPRPDYIPIFSLHPDQPDRATPEFASIRPQRGSGSCYLIPAFEANPAVDDENAPIPVLATTTYRFGPGRPPIVRLFSPHSDPLSREALSEFLYAKREHTKAFASSSSSSHAADSDSDPTSHHQHQKPWDTFPIHSSSLFTRATTFRTSLGTFEWRYGSRAERRAISKTLVPQLMSSSPPPPPFPSLSASLASGSNSNSNDSSHGGGGGGGDDDGGDGKKKEEQHKISSLLILDRLVHVANAYNPKATTTTTTTTTTVRTPVAYLLRGPALRTQGSGASSAGNGGRLVLDLRLWEEGGEEGVVGQTKLDREMVVVLVVATCLVMLKREVDRRRAQQIAIMAGAVAGGG
ncbi:hypothetical protein VTJ49DRAFT_4429 [Mycothermus thermophilus]|uniref:Uncharacterized protein n=1 Tax=Humicola insolens TaxID=85995 RepID=A0ABR3V5R3_HUMIN